MANMAKLPPGCHPYLPRTEINVAMHQYLGADGWYLLRPSFSNKGQYSICVSYHGEVKNFKINRDANGQYSVSSKKFNSLEELLYAYSKNPFRSKKGGTEIYLKYPIPVDKALEQRHIQMHNEANQQVPPQQAQQMQQGPGGPRLPPPRGSNTGTMRAAPNTNGRPGMPSPQQAVPMGGQGAPPLPSRQGAGPAPAPGRRPLPSAPSTMGSPGGRPQPAEEQPSLPIRSQPSVRGRSRTVGNDLAPGWEEFFSQDHNRHYYYQESTGKTVWTKPVAASPQPPRGSAPAPTSAPGSDRRPLPTVPPSLPQRQSLGPADGPPIPDRAVSRGGRGSASDAPPPVSSRQVADVPPPISSRQGADVPPPVNRRSTAPSGPMPPGRGTAAVLGGAPSIPSRGDDGAPPPVPTSTRGRRAAAPPPGEQGGAPPPPVSRGGPPPVPVSSRSAGRGPPPSPGAHQDQGRPPPVSRGGGLPPVPGGFDQSLPAAPAQSRPPMPGVPDHSLPPAPGQFEHSLPPAPAPMTHSGHEQLSDMPAALGFDAPPPAFDAPPPTFDAPPPTFDAPPPTFDAPPVFDTPRASVGAPAAAPAPPAPPPPPANMPAPPPPPPGGVGGGGPPPPPSDAPSLSGIGAALLQGKAGLKKADAPAEKPTDSRGDLLSSIRTGMKLKKVDVSSDPKPPAQPDGAAGGMMGSLMSAIGNRRIAIEDSDEGDDFDEVEDDDW